MKQKTLARYARSIMSLPYKFALGFLLSAGLKLNYFDYFPYPWPPKTPARYYISQFLEAYYDDINGRCLEFFPSYYQEWLKKSGRITDYDVWNIEEAKGVTIVGDLQYAPHVSQNTFNTVICTQVLMCIARPWQAVDELYRIVAPGGLVLCTNPVIVGKYQPHPNDYWRFTKASMEVLFSKFSRIEIHSYGNAATVAGSSQFLTNLQYPKSVLDWHDEACPSIVAIAAWK